MVPSPGLTSAPAFTECFSFGKKWQQGLPQLTSWVWTSIRRAFKRRHLCTGCKHLFGAFWLSSWRVNCNPGPAGLGRRGYKLLVSQPCPTSLPEGPRMVWVWKTGGSQPPRPFFSRGDRAAARSRLCTLRAPSAAAWLPRASLSSPAARDERRVQGKASFGSSFL